VFVVRVWGGEYREELILNVIAFVVRVSGRQFKGDRIVLYKCREQIVWGVW
jgi:hypothetical protein